MTIDDFRDFFKSNKSKNETTFYKIVTDVLNIVETSVKNNNIQIVKNLREISTFSTYENELKQVLLNLIKNAEDVLLENSSVINPTIKIESSKNTLSVSDNGGGISEDIIDKIFDPYFSTKDKKDGTGLGLYMSKIIVEDHCGGYLKVQNSKDGAKFTIVLEDKK
jgi:C4-dicarboxylate-specific signal transduction histidine kinase